MKVFKAIFAIIIALLIMFIFIYAAFLLITGNESWFEWFSVAALLLIINQLNSLISLKMAEMRTVGDLIKLQKGRYVDSVFGKHLTG